MITIIFLTTWVLLVIMCCVCVIAMIAMFYDDSPTVRLLVDTVIARLGGKWTKNK